MTIGLRPVAGLKRPADVWGHMYHRDKSSGRHGVRDRRGSASL